MFVWWSGGFCKALRYERALNPPNGYATTVDFALHGAILPEPVLLNADLVSLEDQLESASHQFHRQLVQITYGTYNS